MKRRPVQVSNAPRAIGPYSQGQVVELSEATWVYTSGQVGFDPATGQFVPGGVAEQADRAIQNVAAILAGAGLTLADVVKTTVFLADMQDFAAMNEVYARHFGEPPPARTTIAARELPRDARVEIEAVAVRRT